jgi:exopolyphosphatase / guanosine-5'-triphosphate,3'-diphosphate pyrophosphatase
MMNNSDTQESQRLIAAVDLGSNSFHMIVACLEENGSLRVVDRIKEMVRLGAGLNRKNFLDAESQQRAIDCLGRFSQRLKNIHPGDVRVAGTNTLRIAKNSSKFIKKAEKTLQHKIDIISGLEEARLVYHGAVYSLAELDNTRLVVDIGGGSTEVIIGCNQTPKTLESLHMGCVSITRKYFSDGVISKSRLKEADIFIRQEIESIRTQYLKTGWDQCVGTSGSIRSISKVLKATGLTDGTITDVGLKKLIKNLVEFGLIHKIKLDGLSSERQQVFIGGLVVLNSIFKAFKLTEMTASDGALREGLMLDIVGRIRHKDIREVTIDRLMQRYNVRIDHAKNVVQSCTSIFRQVEKKWSLDDENDYRLLIWAARIHEIGLAISHSAHQKHGAYLALNSDLPGFSIQEQQVLSLLVRFHRSKILVKELDDFPNKFRAKIIRMIVVLRISVVLNRSTPVYLEPDYDMQFKKHSITLLFPEYWFDDNPLTIADLESEIDYLGTVGFKLKIERKS